MKKTGSLLLLILLVGASSVFAQNRETRNVNSFTEIAYRIPGKLYLRQGKELKVELEGDNALLSEVETEVENSRLVIGTRQPWKSWSWKEQDRINIYITMPEIEGISISGSGNLIAETRIHADHLYLRVSGSGSLKLEADVSGEVEANVSGSGNIVVKGKAAYFTSNVRGSGGVSLEMNIATLADFDVSGSGRIEAAGSTNALRASITGSGRVMASNLETNECSVGISGSGDAEIYAKEKLQARIGGSGNISYKGDPKKLSTSGAGSGRVHKM